MTPEQLTRLQTLLAKGTLTGSENQELLFLKSLATPDQLAAAEAGGDTDEEEEEEEEAEEKDDPAADPAAKAGKPNAARPGLLDHAKALATPKSALVARNSELTAKVGKLTAENSQLSQTIAANAQTIAGLQTEVATLKGQLAEAKAKAKTVSQELAGLGVKERELPGAASEEKGETYKSEAEVSAAIEAAQTWEEKQAILDAWEKQKTA